MQLGVLVLGVFLGVISSVQRLAYADAPQAAPAQSSAVRREGRISIARAINGGTPGSSADAVFANSPVWGAVIGSDGPCTLRRRLPTGGLSAGTINISGTTSPITLAEQRDAGGVRYRRTVPVPNPSYVDGAQITVQASGGLDVPAFTSTITAPQELAGYSPPKSLSRTAGYTATWTAVAGSEIRIVLAAVNARRESLIVACRVPDTGAFTVPASTMKLIPQSLDRAIVIVARIAETVQIVGDTRVIIEILSSVMSGPFALDLIEPPKPRETSPRLFLGFGFGYSNGAATWRLQLGQRLVHGLHLVEEINSLGSSDISADTTEELLSFGAGVRWTPFKPRLRRGGFPIAPAIDLYAVYFTALVGAGLRDRLTTTTDSTEDLAWSPMASLAVGLLAFQGRDWALGPEFRGQLARFDGKVQRDWQLMLAIHLNQW